LAGCDLSQRLWEETSIDGGEDDGDRSPKTKL
jgi:hypothetical protein